MEGKVTCRVCDHASEVGKWGGDIAASCKGMRWHVVRGYTLKISSNVCHKIYTSPVLVGENKYKHRRES